jgi:FAD/FMN-containing dehydrogenase
MSPLLDDTPGSLSSGPDRPSPILIGVLVPQQLVDLSVLEAAVSGRVVRPSDDDYDTLRAGFNAMNDRHPAAIVLVRDEDDVAATIGIARELELPLAIRAGGHSAPGFGCCDDGIVIDLRELVAVDVDRVAQVVRCGSGLTWKQFDGAVQEHGLAVTGGRVSSTGVTGLTIGSGSGWLERAMGLTSDRLIGGRLVTADGDVVSVADDPELLWALRGGGGNFGVITELQFAMQPLGPEVIGGVRMFRFERAAEILRTYRDVMATAPRELCGGLALMCAPPAPFMPPDLVGTAALDALGEPAVDLVGPTTYAAVQQIMDQGAPAGHRDYFKGGFMTELPDDAVDAIVALGADLRAPLTQIICAPLGADTAYGDVGEEHSAIGHRDENWSFQVLSLWSDPGEDAEQKAWTRAASETMSSYSSMVSYPNFISADSSDPTEVEKAYSPAGLERLRAVKDRYDPGNVFRLNHNIRPSAELVG